MNSAIILNSTSTYLHLGSYLTMVGLKKLLTTLNINIIFEHEVNNYNFSEVLRFYNDNNKPLIIVNGEGTFHDDQPFATSILDFLDKNNIDFMILNSQFRNMSNKYIQIALQSKWIQVRTIKDYKYCKKMGINNLSYCPDMIFYSGIKASDYSNNHETGILFTDSHLIDANKKILSNYLFDDELKKTWINIHFHETSQRNFYYRLKFLYYSVLHKKINSLNCKTKLRVLNNLKKTSLSSTLFAFINSKIIVTGRYHGACLSILLKKPLFYSYSNTSKIKDLCDDFSWGYEINKKIDYLAFESQDLDKKHLQITKKLDTYYNSFREDLNKILHAFYK